MHSTQKNAKMDLKRIIARLLKCWMLFKIYFIEMDENNLDFVSLDMQMGYAIIYCYQVDLIEFLLCSKVLICTYISHR
jgi:uncharacterized membrane-anchored protein